MRFTIRIADVNIEINSIYDAVFKLCKDYLANGCPDFCVNITADDIEFERIKSKREAQIEHKAYTDFKESYLETLAVYRKIAVGLLDFGAFVMHGAVVGLNGKAYMFTAPSGVGKTTHTQFWLESFPEAFIINGDKPVIKITKDGAFAYGTPWSGKENRNTNTCLPLKSICFLMRGEENKISPLKFSQVYPMLIQQTYRPETESPLQKTIEYIKELGETVDFYLLYCNLDPSAAKTAFDGMNKYEQV